MARPEKSREPHPQQGGDGGAVASSVTPLAGRGTGAVRTLVRMPRRLYDWVLSWAATPHAPVALAAFAFAEASFFPVPPDVLLIGMCLAIPARSLRYAAICSLGSVFGGLAGYGIGAGLWEVVEPWFYAYVPGFSEPQFARVRELYHAWGLPIVFTAGFSPVPYKLFTIVSGVMGLPLLPFLGASAVSRAARFYLVGWLIYRFGPPIKLFIDRYFGPLVLVGSLLFVGGFAVVKWMV